MRPETSSFGRCIFWIPAIVAAGWVLQAAAEDEDLFFGSLPIVQSVSRLSQPLADAPGAVTVIDRDMIRASGARSVAELMRLVPGFTTTPADQDAPRVTYHGLSNEGNSPRLQVLVDGRSQFSPLFQSGVNWNLLPVALEDIERIEVMRGSNSVSYGSNAVQGVINIITVHPALNQGWMVSTSQGNQSVDDQTLRWGGKVGQADVRLTYQQRADDGLSKMQSGGAWIDPHDSLHTKLFDLQVRMDLTDRDELQVALSQAYVISQYGRPGDGSDPFHDYSQSSGSFNLTWRRALDTGNDIKVRYSHVDDWGSDRHYNACSPDRSTAYTCLTNAGGESTTDEFEYQYTGQVRDDLRVTAGSGVRAEAVNSPGQFYANPHQSRQTYRMFGNLEWRADNRWLFNLGANTEVSSASDETLFDPRASVSYHFAPGQTLRLILSRAHRSPSLYELYGDVRAVPVGATSPVDRILLATPGLKAERVDTLELGYLAESKKLRMSFDFRAFHEYIPNRIEWVPCALSAANADNGQSDPALYPYGRADTYVNGEQVRIRGYEYQWRWQPAEDTRLIVNHAYTSIYSALDDGLVIADASANIARISDQTASSTPQHATTVMLMQKLPGGLEASAIYYKQGYMKWTRNSYIRPFETVDWRLGYPFRVGSTRGEIAYVAQASNGSYDGLRYTRIVTERHWLTLTLNY